MKVRACQEGALSLWEWSDVELLSSALVDAMVAQRDGLVIGPAVDEVALHRATRCALRADVARALRTAGHGGAA